MTHQTKLLLKTMNQGDMCDLTEKVKDVVAESGIQVGMVNVFNVGSTGAIGTIEFEPGLQEDFPAMLNRLIPESSEYGHEQRWQDGNGHSHLQASTIGPEVTIPIRDGQMSLGTWQQIFHLECDVKPRIRDIIVTVYGD